MSTAPDSDVRELTTDGGAATFEDMVVAVRAEVALGNRVVSYYGEEGAGFTVQFAGRPSRPPEDASGEPSR